jgi:glycosyltransferase involved in cell wall biosynthesis
VLERDFMNVLYLACEPRIELAAATGHATHILKTIKGLESKGHSVYRLVAGEGSAQTKAKSTFRALKTTLPASLSLILRDVYALLHDRRFLKHCYPVCRKKEFDFIYERASVFHRTGCQLSKKFCIPLILEVNAPLEEMITLYGCAPALIPVASYIERVTTCKADAVVVGSAGMRQYLVSRGVSPEKIFTIYPTADDHFFSPARRRADIRQKYDLEGKVVVGFVGSMAPYQRVDLLLRAAVEMRRGSNAVHFFIVGDGVGMSELKRFVTDNSLENSVTFTGRVPYEDVPEYAGAMDVCVIPDATWYGAPTKLFEYAASGKPVIAPRVEPIREIIRDGENGLLSEVGDVGSLTEKIMIVAQNPGLGARLGAKLHKGIMQDHTWERNTAKLIEIFESIKRNGHAPAQSLL